MIALIAGLALLLQARAPAAPAATLSEYTVDAGHSIVEFSVPFAFTRVQGRFTRVNGTILYDSVAPPRSSVTIVIESNSIDTGWPHRDEHLRTSDFFDVEKYPTIEFHSERVVARDSGWVMEGPLTMHGVTRQVSIPFRFARRPVRSPDSRWMMLNATGSLTLARADFGIVGGSTFNSWFTAARAATVGDSVAVSLEIEAYYTDDASQRSPGLIAALERLQTGGIEAHVARLRDLRSTKSSADFARYFLGQQLLARALISANEPREAADLARALVQLYPDLHAPRLLYGFTLAVLGDEQGAAREYAAAKSVFRAPVVDPKEKFPQVDETWFWLDNLARTALEWRRAREALGFARAVTELYPDMSRSWVTYGQLLAAAGDTAAAARQYARAIQADPHETRALEWRRRLPTPNP